MKFSLRIYSTVRALKKEIIHDTISEKSEMGKLRKGYCAMKIYEKIFARLEELHMSQTELSRMIIPELSEPPVRTLGATIPENESRLFR